jgi:aspartate kinase
VKVVKFGGSSMASAAQLRKVADIVLADPARKVVVVSAPGKRSARDTKVTDLLIALARAGLTRVDVAAALEAVVERYRVIVNTLKLSPDLIATITADLVARVEADSTQEEVYLDNLKAAGEDHSARV